MSEEKNEKLEDELARIKAEMSEIKELLKEKSEDPDYEVEYTVEGGRPPRRPRGPRPPREPRPPRRPRAPRFVFSSDHDHGIDIDFDELGETMSIHVDNVLEGMEENLARSMEGLSKNFGFKFAKKAEKAKRAAEKEMRKAEKEMRKAERKMRRREKEMRYKPLNEEELEAFFELASNLSSSLSDSRRLKILKELENKPQYPTELSEKLNFKGGTLKHHLDNLVESKFISQEAVRGRYLITQLGMEALKLAEMLFRRYNYMVKKEEEPEIEIRDEDEEGVDIELEDEGIDDEEDEEDEEEEN